MRQFSVSLHYDTAATTASDAVRTAVAAVQTGDVAAEVYEWRGSSPVFEVEAIHDLISQPEPITCSVTEQIEAINRAAAAEGWHINISDYADLRLERDMDLGAFADDTAAWRYVVARARTGSGLHTEALALLARVAPLEARTIRSTVGRWQEAAE